MQIKAFNAALNRAGRAKRQTSKMLIYSKNNTVKKRARVARSEFKRLFCILLFKAEDFYTSLRLLLFPLIFPVPFNAFALLSSLFQSFV